MRGSVIAASLALVLSAAHAFAQAPAHPRPAQPAAPAQPRPAQPTAPAGQQPTAQPPAQTAPAPAPQPPAPFPQGAKIAFVNLQQIASLSAEGKTSSAKVQALIQKKQTEGAEKT